MMRVLVMLSLAMATPAIAQSGDPTVGFTLDDRVMNAAIAEAQHSLPLFLCETVDDEGYGPEGGFVKVRVPVNPSRNEHEIIWVGPFAAWDSQNFAGFLANQPNAIDGMNRGDQLDFTYDMIVDWSWNDPKGNIYGHYTTRVIYEMQGQTDVLADFATPPFDATWSCE
ncbi:DUF2314 domain-containing protein [Yoonia sp. BS5-3]|uniref:DUF2314 domain-containing protein n=1 Tax=Yoonia phaeophyticola TaxID=3137369 RepID=A0ABZ2UZM6_9RHOB